ncbi:MAG: hypothetical protein WCH44_12645 [Betaproteobacteria bacterium]
MAEPKIEDIIKAIQSGGARDLTLKGLTAPNGTKVEEVVIENAKDAKLFKEHFGDVFKAQPSSPVTPSWVTSGGGKFRRLEAHGVAISKRLPPYLASNCVIPNMSRRQNGLQQCSLTSVETCPPMITSPR